MSNKHKPFGPYPCIHCGRLIDSAAILGRWHEPKEGDITVCFYCGAIMIFGPKLRLREPTINEFMEICDDRELVAVRKFVEFARRIKGD